MSTASFSPFVRRPRRRRAFSFLEVMIVVVIIGILSGIVGPRLIRRAGEAKVTATKTALSAVKTALTAYEMSVGDLPTTDQGLAALVERPSDVDENTWSLQMESLPLDGWKREFVYRYPGTDGALYDLISLGYDGKEGTEDDVALRSGLPKS